MFDPFNPKTGPTKSSEIAQASASVSVELGAVELSTKATWPRCRSTCWPSSSKVSSSDLWPMMQDTVAKAPRKLGFPSGATVIFTLSP